MVVNNIEGHVSSDGSSLTDRLERRCGEITSGAWAENIGSDFDVEGRNHALKTVLGLIIDDGVPSRGHRKNIFSNEYKYIGIHSKLQGDKIKTVMNFTSTDLPLIDKNQEDDAPQIKHQNPKKKVPPHKNVKQVHQLGGFKPKNFGDFNSEWGFQGQQGFSKPFSNVSENWGMPNQNFGNKSGERYKVSTSTRTMTETKNGKTVTKVIERVQYSDGTIEENETIHTH